MISYRVQVKTKAGSTLGEFNTFKELSFGKRLNNYGMASFKLPVNDTKASSLIALRLYDIFIYQINDGVETLVWAGEQAMREGRLDDRGNNWVTIHAYDWLEQLNSRFTVAEREFLATDQGAIAMTLIDETQADTDGDLGITEGSIATTLDRDIVFNNQNVMEAIIKLADTVNGFDFELTNQKIFNVYTLKGSDRTDQIRLEYGLNIISAQVVEDFTNPATRAIVTGEEYGGTDITRIEPESAPGLAQYGLREYMFNETDVVSDTSLEDRGNAILNKYGGPVLKIDCTLKKSSISITDFALGDLINVKIVNGIYNIDQDYRIYEWNVTYNDDNTETLRLTLSTLNATI